MFNVYTILYIGVVSFYSRGLALCYIPISRGLALCYIPISYIWGAHIVSQQNTLVPSR